VTGQYSEIGIFRGKGCIFGLQPLRLRPVLLRDIGRNCLTHIKNKRPSPRIRPSGERFTTSSALGFNAAGQRAVPPFFSFSSASIKSFKAYIQCRRWWHRPPPPSPPRRSHPDAATLAGSLSASRQQAGIFCERVSLFLPLSSMFLSTIRSPVWHRKLYSLTILQNRIFRFHHGT